MKAIEVQSKRKWRQSLENRNYMELFPIPSPIVIFTGAANKTKRYVQIEISTGVKMKGVASVSSGTEIYIPKHLQRYFEKADYFHCEIVNNKLYEKVSLDIY